MNRLLIFLARIIFSAILILAALFSCIVILPFWILHRMMKKSD